MCSGCVAAYRAMRWEQPISLLTEFVASIYWQIYFEFLQEIKMQETRTAKLFKNGSSQAVRLPAEFRFEGDEIYISRDDTSGDVVLSSRPSAKTWDDFFEYVHRLDVPEDFMAERPMNVPPKETGVFDDVAPA